MPSNKEKDTLVIVCASYKPNTAPSNRIFAMLKAYDIMGVDVEMVYIYPNDKCEHVDLQTHIFSHIHFTYLWDYHPYKNKYIKYAMSFYDAWKYASKLKNGTKVFLYSCSEYLPYFIRNKGICVYQEKTEHYEVVPTTPYFLQRRYLRSIPSLTGMFVISEPLRDAYLQLGAKNITIINMIVDAERFLNTTKKTQNEEYIAYCGTASNNKDGVDILIKSFAIIHQQYPRLKLYIIGETPSKNDKAGNIALVRNLGLEEVIVFKGIVSSEEMPQMLTNAKILALARPNNLQALCGFPTKLGEYLLTGNPVVVTKVGDIPRFLEDYKTALLAIPGDPIDFAQKVLWVLEHPQEAINIGQKGKRIAMTHFNNITETTKICKTIFNQ